MTLIEIQRVLALNMETGHLTWLVGHVIGRRAGSFASGGYRQVKIGGQNYLEHRVVWLLATGAWPEGKLDHENRVRTDNRPSNLRPATTSQNAQNKGARGVCHIPGTSRRRERWEARIKLNGKSHHLGLHRTEEAALTAYRAAKLALHPFATRNL